MRMDCVGVAHIMQDEAHVHVEQHAEKVLNHSRTPPLKGR